MFPSQGLPNANGPLALHGGAVDLDHKGVVVHTFFAVGQDGGAPSSAHWTRQVAAKPTSCDNRAGVARELEVGEALEIVVAAPVAVFTPPISDAIRRHRVSGVDGLRHAVGRQLVNDGVHAVL